jgi:hypothetical protein
LTSKSKFPEEKKKEEKWKKKRLNFDWFELFGEFNWQAKNLNFC